MRKEIRTVDTEKGIVQVTIADERWYTRPVVDPVTGLPQSYLYVPSVTWISSYYPKGVAFYRWLAEKGWDEAQAIKAAAGDRGSKVHQACWSLLLGETVEITSKFLNPTTEAAEELTLDEYDCVLAFADFWKTKTPMHIRHEFVVWNEQPNFAGTVDLLCEMDGALWVLDLKTGQNVWPEHELQVSAYATALQRSEGIQDLKTGILQVGYRANKRRWKFTPIENQYDLFLAAHQIWAKETAGIDVFRRDYPLRVALQQGEKLEPLRQGQSPPGA